MGVTNDTAWYIKPKDGLSIGTHTATIEFRNIENKMSAPATNTVTFEVMDNFDTSTWNQDEGTHWNPCTDSGCTARGNEAPHNSDVKMQLWQLSMRMDTLRWILFCLRHGLHRAALYLPGNISVQATMTCSSY